MDLVFPRQLFINGQFVESVSGDTMPTVNPTTEEVGVPYCNLQCATGVQMVAWPVGGDSSGAIDWPLLWPSLVRQHLY